MLNYLARLGWSHGDEELFSREQMLQWFDGSHLAKSPAQWDPAKLAWVNGHYIKQADDDRLAELVAVQLSSRGLNVAGDARLPAMCALYKDRCKTTAELADWLAMYFAPVIPPADELARQLTEPVRAALDSLHQALADVDWQPAAIAAAIKQVLTSHQLKMPQLAIPLRLLLCGRSQTPSVDAVVALFDRDLARERLRHQ